MFPNWLSRFPPPIRWAIGCLLVFWWGLSELVQAGDNIKFLRALQPFIMPLGIRLSDLAQWIVLIVGLAFIAWGRRGRRGDASRAPQHEQGSAIEEIMDAVDAQAAQQPSIDDMIDRRIRRTQVAEIRAGFPPSPASLLEETAPSDSLGMTPEQIVEHYNRGSTTAQREARVQSLKGKLVGVSGKFVDLEKSLLRGFRVEIKRPSGLFVWGEFSEKHRDSLGSLVPGEEITVEGRLSHVHQQSISLKHCELRPPSLP